jgi:DNA ligase D-like protein (predicted ligase)
MAEKTSQPVKRTTKAAFVESMECLGVKVLPTGKEWSFEIKLDGYRLEAVKNAGEVLLYSRRRNLLNEKFAYIAKALTQLPKETIVDGEIVAVDEKGRSDFNLLQNFRSAESKIHYFAFDLLMLKGKSLLQMPLDERRALLDRHLPRNEHITTSVVEHGTAAGILKFVKANGLEGVIAKRSESVYEPGKRSGLWQKHRVNQGQEFLIGGYTPGSNGFDAIIIGYYQGKDLMFAARVRAGFVPRTRQEVFTKINPLKVATCPFVNLPEKEPGRWGQGLTAEKMKGCVWVKPRVVVRIDFAEWTGGGKLRHTSFFALREDKDPKKVVREEN